MVETVCEADKLIASTHVLDHLILKLAERLWTYLVFYIITFFSYFFTITTIDIHKKSDVHRHPQNACNNIVFVCVFTHRLSGLL